MTQTQLVGKEVGQTEMLLVYKPFNIAVEKAMLTSDMPVIVALVRLALANVGWLPVVDV